MAQLPVPCSNPRRSPLQTLLESPLPSSSPSTRPQRFRRVRTQRRVCRAALCRNPFTTLAKMTTLCSRRQSGPLSTSRYCPRTQARHRALSRPLWTPLPARKRSDSRRLPPRADALLRARHTACDTSCAGRLEELFARQRPARQRARPDSGAEKNSCSLARRPARALPSTITARRRTSLTGASRRVSALKSATSTPSSLLRCSRARSRQHSRCNCNNISVRYSNSCSSPRRTLHRYSCNCRPQHRRLPKHRCVARSGH
nr:MAG: hypothetical protein [Molluscum contagiosum virus]